MLTFFRAAGIGGSILVILALIIYLLKTLIAFIAFLTGAIKILIVLAFAGVIIVVGLLVLRSLIDRRRSKE